MIEDQEEMKCPKCGGDMKEYATRFRCRRNGKDSQCTFVFIRYFPVTTDIEQDVRIVPFYKS